MDHEGRKDAGRVLTIPTFRGFVGINLRVSVRGPDSFLRTLFGGWGTVTEPKGTCSRRTL